MFPALSHHSQLQRPKLSKGKVLGSEAGALTVVGKGFDQDN
jgi:hypothetical protein